MRTHHTLTLGLAVFLGIANIAHATGAPSQQLPVPRHAPQSDREHRDLVMLRTQMARHPQLPPIEFWEAVAQCETNRNWEDKGRYAGGLGIATDPITKYGTTWEGYGGRAFGRTPDKATKWGQIIVANRIGFLGYQTRNEYRTLADKLAGKPLFRPAAGFSQGWGGKCRQA